MQRFGALSLSGSFLLGILGIIIKAWPGHDLSWSHKSFIFGKNLNPPYLRAVTMKLRTSSSPDRWLVSKITLNSYYGKRKWHLASASIPNLNTTIFCSLWPLDAHLHGKLYSVCISLWWSGQRYNFSNKTQSPLWREVRCPFQQLRFSLGSDTLELLSQDFLNFTHTPSSQFLPHLLIISPVICTLYFYCLTLAV